MPNFGIPRRAPDNERRELTALSMRRGRFRVWLVVSVGWIMGWSIYLILEGMQGGLPYGGGIAVPILLFTPPVALWIFGSIAFWALRGFNDHGPT